MPFGLSLGYCVIYMYYSDNKRRLMHQLIYIYIYISFFFAIYSGYGRVVQGAGHKAKQRLVLHCINAVSSNPVEGRTQICQLTYLILTLLDYIFAPDQIRIGPYVYGPDQIRILIWSDHTRMVINELDQIGIQTICVSNEKGDFEGNI